MKKEVCLISMCMLLITVTVLPVTGSINDNTDFKKETDDYDDLIQQVTDKRFILDDDWPQQNKLLASDGAAYDHFGYSVSIDGDYAIIGARHDDDNGVDSGSAYIFTRSGSTWTEQAKLLATDGEAGDEFGYSVSIDGDYAIIGAHLEDGTTVDSGSAYIFIRSGSAWTHQAKLTGLNGEADDEFGCSVSIDGDWAVVGARYDDDNGVDSGSAFMFTRSGSVWIHEAKLLATDGEAGDEFGCSVSIDGDYAIIGAYLEDGTTVDSGSAYIFIRSGSTWTEQAKLFALDRETYDYFGRSVSIDGDYAIVGAYGDDDNGDRSGSAYIFIRSGSTWTEQAKLLATDGELIDYFGLSVSIDGDCAIIGAFHDDDNGDWSGSAYMFTRSGSTWTEQSKLTASDGAMFDEFGCSVSIDGDYAVVGANFDNDNGDNSGSAYIFKNNNPPSAPTITGPTNGKPNIEYDFTVMATDPDDDDIYYEIDWGDSYSEGGGPYNSGEPMTRGHIWAEEGTYTVKAKAFDIYEAESDWTTLTITIPRNKIINRPFLNFLQSHPVLFPLLQKLIQQQFGFGQ